MDYGLPRSMSQTTCLSLTKPLSKLRDVTSVQSVPTHNETSVAVEHVVQLAETRHCQAVVNMADNANHEHQRQMAKLTQEAQHALQLQSEVHSLREQHLQQEAMRHAAQIAATEAAYSTRLSQLELALELQENHNAQLLEKERNRVEMVSRAWGAHRSPEHSSPDSAQDLDGMSNCGSMRSQPGFLASLTATMANPFANTVGIHLRVHHRRTPATSQLRV